MAYNYIVNQGVIVPDTSTTLAEVQGEYLDALGQDLDLAPSTPQGQMITAEVAARNGVINNNALLANQLNPNESTGVFLRSVGSLMGISDTPVSRSVALNVAVTGTPGLSLPAGSEAVNAQGAIFLSISTVTFVDDGTGVGRAVVTFQARDPGAVQAPAGTLVPKSAVPGWSGMNNPTDAVLGSVAMTDYEYRIYRQAALSNQSQNSTNAAKSKVSMLPGITSVVVRDNDDSAQQTIDGVVMPPNSLWVCVNDDGGIGPDIAMTLLGCKAPGCKWTPGVPSGSFGTPEMYSVTDPITGQAYSVTFVRSVPKTVYVKMTVKNNASAADMATAAVDAILTYAKGKMEDNPGLVIGQDVSPFELSGAVVAQIPGSQVEDCQVSFDGVAWQYTPLVIHTWERANLPESNIQITVQN
jgi:hypothetical protein